MTRKYFWPTLCAVTLLTACGGGDEPDANTDTPITTTVTVPMDAPSVDPIETVTPGAVSASDFVTARRGVPVSRNENILVNDDHVALVLQDPTASLANAENTPLEGSEDYIFTVDFDATGLVEEGRLRTTVWMLDADGNTVNRKAFVPFEKQFDAALGRQTLSFAFGVPGTDSTAPRQLPNLAEGQSLRFLLIPLNKVEGQAIKVYNMNVTRR